MNELFTKEDIVVAYRKLKHYFYYDNTTLFIRNEIAEYEANGDIDQKLEDFYKSINAVEHDFLNSKIDLISYQVTPKKIKREAYKFITNKVKQDNLEVERLSFFIDAKVEVHLLAVLWLINVGKLLKKNISDSNYAYKLEMADSSNKNEPKVVNGLRLYAPYFTQYQKWRDKAIQTAEEELKNNKDVVILNLDIKDYFHNVKINLKELKNSLFKSHFQLSNNEKERIELLFSFLQKIHTNYKQLLSERLKLVDFSEDQSPLPIGLLSSGMLGNYYLKDFDQKVKDELNPSYYGRYVDDILFVITNPVINFSSESPMHSFLNRYFVSKEILQYEKINKKIKTYLNEIDEESQAINIPFAAEKMEDLFNDIQYKTDIGLVIQGKKVSFQYFDKKESRAAINIFKKGIDKNRSEFRFLPEEESVNAEFDEEAFSIHYTDSVNKIRSISELSEDKYGASKFLAKKIFASLYSEDSHDPVTTVQILTFFKGHTAILFHTLWEKAITYFIVNNQPEHLNTFIIQVRNTIATLKEKLENDFYLSESESVTKPVSSIIGEIRESLHNYLNIAISIPLALNPEFQKKIPVIKDEDVIKLKTIFFRKSNLLRHAYVSVPLLNYTNYSINNTYKNLLKVDLNSIEYPEKKLSIDPNSTLVRYSPRFTHFHECTILKIHEAVLKFEDAESLLPNNDPFSTTVDTGFDLFWLLNYESKYPNNEALKKEIQKKYYLLRKEDNDYNRYEVTHKEDFNCNLRAAIANINVSSNHIRNSYLGTPILDRTRREVLFDLLNQAEKEKSDLFVLPEVSVPHEWLKLLPYQSYKRGMAIVAGLEHWVNKYKYAFNFLVTVLPVKVGEYATCVVKIRLKNHYSHEEKRELLANHCKIPNDHLYKSYISHGELEKAQAIKRIPQNYKYDLFVWNKVYFSVYNCFELANIQDRGIFKAKVDFVVASEYNKDTYYFSDIAGSWVRDIHCYFIQVNTSSYGDSRITKPSKNITRDILQLKGGDNATILTGKLHIKELRDFQFVSYELQKDWSEQKPEKFKPTPPDFDRNEVEKRIKGE